MFILKTTTMQTIHCKRSIVYSYFFVGMILTASGCKKFLEPDYKTIVPTAVVFSNDDNAKAAISGLYGSLSSNQSSNGEITRALGMAADELRYFSSDRLYDQFSANHVLPDNDKVNMFWADFYNIIYQCNAIIENAVTSTGMSAAFKTQIIGEAKFLRAYSHFYLVNLFGPVPLITATAKEKTAYAPRSSEADVYAQIKADLTDAMNALPADYSVSGGKRVRANKWAAVALLARVYLYTREWAKAEAMATAVPVIATDVGAFPELLVTGEEEPGLILARASVGVMAEAAATVNAKVENIGARRLQTVIERVMEDISFTASDMHGQTVTIDADYVRKRLGDIATDADLSRYIL